MYLKSVLDKVFTATEAVKLFYLAVSSRFLRLIFSHNYDFFFPLEILGTFSKVLMLFRWFSASKVLHLW